ncbi:MAG: 1-deoxy-D-xylulose-5-phosphate synthase, partial [Dehalococcoidia bacterium]|nr:1-deoxy-D-xylulose-5-phosphate synthase [Dehalococcoidia bacterium]
MRGQIVLERISGPSDIQGLNACELKELCADIRRVLVDGVTETGGHLSSNLGIVELTVALHRVFNSPVDGIVWDVGHQSYVHKLLTGRGGRFDSLRQYGGLSGFPDPAESVHDAFVAGHAGAGISAAMGMAIARDRLCDGGDVVAVIGDGSLTTGMSYEALNHVGHLRTGMVIVLNDNGMSISPTAGSLARRLHMFRTGATYSRMKRDADDALSGLPWGRRFRWLLSRLKAGFKSMVTPVMLFEDLGV